VEILRTKYITDYKEKDIDFRRDFEHSPHLLESRGLCCCYVSNKRAVKVIILLDCLSVLTGIFVVRAIAALLAFIDYSRLACYSKIRFITLYVTLTGILALYTYYAYKIAFSSIIEDKDMIWYLSTTIPLSIYLIIDLHFCYVVLQRVEDDKLNTDKMFMLNNESSMINRTNMIGDHSVTDFSNLMINTQSPEPAESKKRAAKKSARR